MGNLWELNIAKLGYIDGNGVTDDGVNADSESLGFKTEGERYLKY